MELRDREESPPPPTTPPTVVEMVAVTDNYYNELNDLIYFFGEALHNSPVSPMASISPASPVSPVAPVSPVCSEFPPSLPLPSPQSANSSTPVQLLTASPSAALIMNVLPSVCRPAASSSPMDPLSPPPASVPPAPPLLCLAPPSPRLRLHLLSHWLSICPQDFRFILRRSSMQLSSTIGVTGAYRLIGSIWVSICDGCISVGRPQGVSNCQSVISTMAPPALNSALGPHPGWSLKSWDSRNPHSDILCTNFGNSGPLFLSPGVINQHKESKESLHYQRTF